MFFKIFKNLIIISTFLFGSFYSFGFIYDRFYEYTYRCDDINYDILNESSLSPSVTNYCDVLRTTKNLDVHIVVVDKLSKSCNIEATSYFHSRMNSKPNGVLFYISTGESKLYIVKGSGVPNVDLDLLKKDIGDNFDTKSLNDSVIIALRDLGNQVKNINNYFDKPRFVVSCMVSCLVGFITVICISPILYLIKLLYSAYLDNILRRNLRGNRSEILCH